MSATSIEQAARDNWGRVAYEGSRQWALKTGGGWLVETHEEKPGVRLCTWEDLGETFREQFRCIAEHVLAELARSATVSADACRRAYAFSAKFEAAKLAIEPGPHTIERRGGWGVALVGPNATPDMRSEGIEAIAAMRDRASSLNRAQAESQAARHREAGGR